MRATCDETGVFTTRQLNERGLGQTAIRHALAEERLTRLRRGWYSQSGADAKVVRAVAQRGVLGCVSALEHHGAWVPMDPDLHIRRDHNEQRRLGAGVRCCQPWGGPDSSPDNAVDDVGIALRSAWRCLDRENFIACVDSLVHKKIAAIDAIRAEFGGCQEALAALAQCDKAESGTESLVRLRLRSRRVKLRTQVRIGKKRVDMLVGECLVIEVDSKAHHTGVENYAKDRLRDMELRALGYIVVRITYEQVMYDWDAVEQHLLAMIRRGDQWWGSRRGLRPEPARRVVKARKKRLDAPNRRPSSSKRDHAVRPFARDDAVVRHK